MVCDGVLGSGLLFPKRECFRTTLRQVNVHIIIVLHAFLLRSLLVKLTAQVNRMWEWQAAHSGSLPSAAEIGFVALPKYSQINKLIYKYK